jgi:hypothetical protein
MMLFIAIDNPLVTWLGNLQSGRVESEELIIFI